jgi:hypothetical protein
LLGNDKVWLDFNDNNNGSNVPLFDGGIFDEQLLQESLGIRRDVAKAE